MTFRTLLAPIAATALLAVATPALAVSLSLDPSADSVGTGQAFEVDVAIAGLGDGAPPSLGGFDIDILFDDVLFEFEGVSFGPSLGAPDYSFTSHSASGGGLALLEISLVDTAILNDLQPGDFVLATLQMRARDELGVGSFDFGDAFLASAENQAILAEKVGAQVEVVPEPTALVVFALGLGLVATSVRRASATA